ncbi:MAG TPA: cyanophycinase [Terriglobales bacterium]|nr:cyanophycinase [Terriglobales bacterium]
MFAIASNAATRGPKQGTLVIVGGGQLGPEIIQRFVQLAGGKDANFVVIPTASEEPTIDLEKTKERFAKQFGVTNVTVLHTKDRKVADSKQFTEPLRHASAVWIPGGRQWRLADSYLNTRTEKEIKNVLKRGGVVGGSSAGATIQGSYLVRGAVEGNTIMMSPGHEAGFALLTDSAIDQHIITRHREADLDPVVEKFPRLLGIGIDEGTAIVVHGESFEVIGKSKVAIHDGREHEGKKFYFLTAGQKYDLKHRAVMAAAGDR